DEGEQRRAARRARAAQGRCPPRREAAEVPHEGRVGGGEGRGVLRPDRRHRGAVRGRGGWAAEEARQPARAAGPAAEVPAAGRRLQEQGPMSAVPKAVRAAEGELDVFGAYVRRRLERWGED